MAKNRKRNSGQKLRQVKAYVLVPRHAKKGDKAMLADPIKAQPTTPELKKAKIFLSRTGAANFMTKHPEIQKRFRYARADAVAI